MDISAKRVENLRRVIEGMGGVTKAARTLGYVNPSFISQMIGPKPSRVITEKTARKFEREIGLPVGHLDLEVMPDFVAQPSQMTADNYSLPADGAQSDEMTKTELLALVDKVIEIVGKACEDEGVQVGPSKFSTLLSMGLDDAVEHSGTPRQDKIRSLVRLVK